MTGADVRVGNYRYLLNQQTLIKDMNVIDAIIGLPANCFQGTSIPVCCIVLKKERNGNSDNICFIDASREFESGKSQNYITDDHIEKIVNTYIARKNSDKYCHIASMEEIEENGYNLNIPRYVDTFEKEPIIDIPTVKANIEKHTTDGKALDEKLQKLFAELGI